MTLLGTAPKTVKIFINQTRTLGFDEAEKTAFVQELKYAMCFLLVMYRMLILILFIFFQSYS